MVPLRQHLIKMGWHQLRSPVKMENSTAVVVTNKTIFPKRTKSMGMCFHWLCCSESQGQFRYYWDPVDTNIVNYSTKNHSPLYHEAHQPTYAG